MAGIVFTDDDLRRIKAEGLTPESVLDQIDLFKAGLFPLRLNRPCTLNDGIRTLSEEEMRVCIRLYDEAAAQGRVMKFVPASGAATRMFQDWLRAYQGGGFRSKEEASDFVSSLKQYAFYNDLRDVLSRKGREIEKLTAEERYGDLLGAILMPGGLHYADLPKALLKFHVYAEGNRTSLEEHLVEAALYVRDGRGACRIHFTVSDEHESLVRDHIAQVRGYYEDRYGLRFDVGLSTQRSSTNTIAVDGSGHPFRDRTGALVFRPGGHGALLENLDRLDGDIVMVKNIDNVVPDRLKASTVCYKKVLGGYLVGLQKEISRLLEGLAGDVEGEDLFVTEHFCRSKLCVAFPSGFDALSKKEKRDALREKLNRPVRVCGMVRNEGEPGGGPFWVDEADGTRTIQIVEESQIRQNSEDQKRIWKSATHFNPVDLACGVRDVRSKKFDLQAFIDGTSYLITAKVQDGREMKVLERPGLWNGSMAFWNTVFIEVPSETFNPVKTIHDLLRERHLPD